METLRSTLTSAVERFNKSGDRQKLLCPVREEKKKGSPETNAVSERAIAHRLAVYFEDELRRKGIVTDAGQLSVDCEYDRHLDAQKKLESPDVFKKIVIAAGRKAVPLATKPGYFRFSVAPDVILHERGVDDHNLAVIEVKKSSNTEGSDYDNLKLTLFTTAKPYGFGYTFGARVVARDDLPPLKRCLEIVEEYPAA